MLDLAISINTDPSGVTVVETNHGAKLKAPAWPQDCDFQLVGFNPSGERCEVVWTEDLAEDIGRALMTLDRVGALRGRKPDWYRRLACYAKGTSAA
jgi:hypothetical protein